MRQHEATLFTPSEWQNMGRHKAVITARAVMRGLSAECSWGNVAQIVNCYNAGNAHREQLEAKQDQKKKVSLTGFAVFIHSTHSDLRREKHKTI